MMMDIRLHTSEQPAHSAPREQPRAGSSNETEWIDFRDLTVGPGRKSEIPLLRIEGVWLRRAGFAVGSKVMVSVAEGRLVIEPITAPRDLLLDSSPKSAARG